MTPDVNILVAASRDDHPHHQPALRWLEQALDDAAGGSTLTILPMVSTGFLRVVTHPRIFVQPTPVGAAIDFLQTLLNSPGVRQANLGCELEKLLPLCRSRQLTGNDIPDAWIAAATQYHKLHLVTFDHGFTRLLKSHQFTLLSP